MMINNNWIPKLGETYYFHSSDGHFSVETNLGQDYDILIINYIPIFKDEDVAMEPQNQKKTAERWKELNDTLPDM